MSLRLKDFLLQDIRRRYTNNDFMHCLLRYYRIPAFKLLINYRLGQYLSLRNAKGGVNCLR